MSRRLVDTTQQAQSELSTADFDGRLASLCMEASLTSIDTRNTALRQNSEGLVFERHDCSGQDTTDKQH